VASRHLSLCCQSDRLILLDASAAATASADARGEALLQVVVVVELELCIHRAELGQGACRRIFAADGTGDCVLCRLRYGYAVKGAVFALLKELLVVGQLGRACCLCLRCRQAHGAERDQAEAAAHHQALWMVLTQLLVFLGRERACAALAKSKAGEVCGAPSFHQSLICCSHFCE
jgi:hypothetical protein